MHPNYQTPPDALIPCCACAGCILSIFCALPSWYTNTYNNSTKLTLIRSLGCNLSGDFLMLNNECTCLKVSKVEGIIMIIINLIKSYNILLKISFVFALIQKSLVLCPKVSVNAYINAFVLIADVNYHHG